MEALSVRDPTDVANARRRIVSLAAARGYDATEAGGVAIVVTELARNLLRHGGGGEILADADPRCASGLEIMALDRGPGMADVTASLRDGYSTGGTPGKGLGAIRRLAREVLIHSTRGSGTAVLVRIDRNAGGPGTDRTNTDGTNTNDPTSTGPARATATLCVPKLGETVCGVTAAICVRPDGTVAVLLADGLGHGPDAAAASQDAAALHSPARLPHSIASTCPAPLPSVSVWCLKSTGL